MNSSWGETVARRPKGWPHGGAMSKLDQFASAFKSAAKTVYHFTRLTMPSVLVITDLDEEATRVFADDVRGYLSSIADKEATTWASHRVSAGEDVADLLAEIEAKRPDLICCYRNLHGRARSYPFSLGAHVDVLTQATTTPVLLLPVPTEEGRLDPACRDTDRVMVMTDHLTGSDRLIDYAVRFTERDGTLWLAHLENDSDFERYIDVIGKIPSIETDEARALIREQLLKEPSDYIESVRRELENDVSTISVGSDVRMGHHVADCKQLVEDHDIDLLVMNTKDDEQLAMHGLAYPIAVELRNTPLLML
jgi:Universal stress protein family